MPPLDPPHALRDVLLLVLWVSLVALALALVVGLFIWRRLRRLVVSGGGFWQTLREVPLALVVFIDLLDLGLESFSAPIIWLLLRRLGLTALREVATVEAIIPITGPIPTMTICWLLARVRKGGSPVLGRGDFEAKRTLQAHEVAPGKWEARG